MKHSIFIISCLLLVCVIVSNSQSVSSTSRAQTTTNPPIISTTTTTGTLSCVCSCCSGLRCKPVTLRKFVDSTCTTKACKEKCKVFEPKDCDHTFFGTNDAYCTV